MFDPGVLVERGYALLPLAPRSKVPHADLLHKMYRSGKWSPLAKKPATRAEVSEWIKIDPSCNFGLITGAASGNIVVLDVDDPVRMPRQRFSPAPPMTITGRGFHLFFQSDGPVKTQRLSWGEIKGEGGYVVIPPSLKADGSPYLWAASLIDRDPPQFPECLRTKAQEHTCLRDMFLDTLLRSESFILRAASHLGSPISYPEAKFTCVLHPDEHEPSANFHRTGDGTFLFRCWHIDKSLKLGDLYRRIRTGKVGAIGRGVSALWLVRLAIDSGYTKAPVVSSPRLPEGAPGQAQRVLEGCRLLQQCRLLYDRTNEAFPATVGFLVEWCGVTDDEALGGKRWLIRHGFLVVHERGHYVYGGQGKATLYKLGTGDIVPSGNRKD